MDLLGGGHVGGGDGVVGELCDAELAAIDGDGVDDVAGVGLLGGGDGFEVGGETDAVEVADEDLGVGDGAVGAEGCGHVVEGEGDGVEVALGDDAGGVDEVLEGGAALDGGLVEVGGGADGFELDVDDGVGLGEETRGLRGSVGAEIEREAEGREDSKNNEQRNDGTSSHCRYTRCLNCMFLSYHRGGLGW